MKTIEETVYDLMENTAYIARALPDALVFDQGARYHFAGEGGIVARCIALAREVHEQVKDEDWDDFDIVSLTDHIWVLHEDNFEIDPEDAVSQAIINAKGE